MFLHDSDVSFPVLHGGGGGGGSYYRFCRDGSGWVTYKLSYCAWLSGIRQARYPQVCQRKESSEEMRNVGIFYF